MNRNSFYSYIRVEDIIAQKAVNSKHFIEKRQIKIKILPQL